MAEKKTVKKKKEATERKESAKGSKNNERTLRNLLIIAGVILIGGFLGVTFRGDSESSFDYRGVNYTIEKFCDAGPCLITYNAKLPVIYQGERADYNFFLRNDARKLEKEVSFDGDFSLKDKMVLEVSYGRSCEGYSAVAMDNFGNLLRVAGTEVESRSIGETCNPDSDEMYVRVQEGSETKIEGWGNSCYNIYIKECEVLKGVERFMNEVLVEVNKNL